MVDYNATAGTLDAVERTLTSVEAELTALRSAQQAERRYHRHLCVTAELFAALEARILSTVLGREWRRDKLVEPHDRWRQLERAKHWPDVKRKWRVEQRFGDTVNFLSFLWEMQRCRDVDKLLVYRPDLSEAQVGDIVLSFYRAHCQRIEQDINDWESWDAGRKEAERQRLAEQRAKRMAEIPHAMALVREVLGEVVRRTFRLNFSR